MPNREKVIKGLEHCRKTACESCPYNATDVKNSNPICLINEMLSDALVLLKEQNGLMLALDQSNAVNGYLNAEVERLNVLLKEQEAVEPITVGNDYRQWRCPKCRDRLRYRLDKFCPHCGRSVKWE